MKTNYVLIDYENVQPEAMAGLCEDHFKVLVFVEKINQRSRSRSPPPFSNVGDRAEYVKITGNGKMPLDFHIAYYFDNSHSRPRMRSFILFRRTPVLIR